MDYGPDRNGETDAVRLARGGDRDAFRRLVEAHAPAVFRLAYRMTGNESDADDMVQETFLRAWREMPRFDERAAFGTWLHRICANRSIDLLRTRKKWQEVRVPEGAAEERNMTHPLTNVSSPDPSPERFARSAQVRERLEPALAALSGMERTTFILRHYEGLGIDAIAEQLGVQKGAARHSLFRAVRKLRRALEPLGNVS